MKNLTRHLSFYVGTIALSLIALAVIFHFGPEDTAAVAAQSNDLTWLSAMKRELTKNIALPITGLLIQLIVILGFSRLCAAAFHRCGQPRVVGEMIAGILLGRSVFAAVWPDGFQTVFPEDGMRRLYCLSQVGLIFFMFVVGLDLKVSELKNRFSAAVLISHSSIVLPFLLGALLAIGLYPEYGPENFSFMSFALFMGIAMSITAFPVLARIIQEKKMTESPLGVMALTCAAIDDVTAWIILAAVIGFVKAGSGAVAVGMILTVVLYVSSMFWLVRPVLGHALKPSTKAGEVTQPQLALIFGVLLGSALVTEIIGIHALFGAFLAGTIMPQNLSFRTNLIGKIEDFSAVVLLPIFFVYTGLRMEVGLLNTVDVWMMCAAIVLLAVVGKMLGSAIPARLSGMSWRNSWALGALMNTRGLMELVVLNIGYDIGILSPVMFTMMVLMAVITTAMTGPLLHLLRPKMKAA